MFRTAHSETVLWRHVSRAHGSRDRVGALSFPHTRFEVEARKRCGYAAYMHTTDISRWQHTHNFHSENPSGERNTRRVVVLTACMMVAEIVAGWMFNSMALLADGWHMSSHVLALGLTAGSYALARRFSADTSFAFGTWKIEVLGGFTSAVLLAGIALLMAIESIERLFRPVPIQFDQAIIVAALGLAVNVASALLLRNRHDHHEHPHSHAHAHRRADLNLEAAYLHVIADATTSLLAILALVGGKYLHWDWLDSTMGIVGAAMVSAWAWGLLRETSRVLLDREMDSEIVREIREVLERDGETKLSDLHVWRVARDKFACAASVVTHEPKEPAHYKSLLRVHDEIAHVTLEVNRCPNGSIR
jgi:cation diffusion facilitator family transporter